MNPIAETCRNSIIQALDHYGLPASESAVKLLCMIGAHESAQFLYNKQVNGPALSPFQIEPASYLDVCEYANRKLYMPDDLPSPAERLIFDFRFATGIARVFLLRIPEPLPAKHDLRLMAIYAKKYWNTLLGKATPDMYLSAYQELFSED